MLWIKYKGVWFPTNVHAWSIHVCSHKHGHINGARMGLPKLQTHQLSAFSSSQKAFFGKQCVLQLNIVAANDGWPAWCLLFDLFCWLSRLHLHLFGSKTESDWGTSCVGPAKWLASHGTHVAYKRKNPWTISEKTLGHQWVGGGSYVSWSADIRCIEKSIGNYIQLYIM